MALTVKAARSSVAPVAIGDLPELPADTSDRASLLRWWMDTRQVLRRLLESAANSAPDSLTNGVMLRSAYDADGDGVVDRAGSVEWANIAGKPASYPAAAHSHQPGDVAGLTEAYQAIEELQAQVGGDAETGASAIQAAVVDFGIEQSWAEVTLAVPSITMADHVEVWIEGSEEAAVLQISCGLLRKIEGVGITLWAFAPTRASGVFTLSYRIN